jgi:hypothetical protein
MSFFLISLSGFLGYLSGRIGHYWLNPLCNNPAWAPHHWIYGLLLIALGIQVGGFVGLLVVAFGLGCFISDLTDFLNGEVIGPDDDTLPPKFWGID